MGIMGRPPIGKKTMSATERQRRWRAKLRASKRVLQVPAAQLERLIQAAVSTAMEKVQVETQRLVDSAKETQLWYVDRIRELESELARERDQRLAPIDPDSLPKRHRKKLKFARQQQDREFEDRVKQKAHSLLDELFRPSGAQQDAVAEQVLPSLRERLEQFRRQNQGRVTQTGYRDMRPVPGAVRKSARATKH